MGYTILRISGRKEGVTDINILENLPLEGEFIDKIIEYIRHTNRKGEVLITTFFKDQENNTIIKYIVELMDCIELCRTYIINGELSDLQKTIRTLSKTFDIKTEDVIIDTKGNQRWLELI